MRAALADEAYPVGGAASSERYGADFWASPLQTLGSGAGDCEDYAIVKYVVLRELGITADDPRLIIVQDQKRETGHAVVSTTIDPCLRLTSMERRRSPPRRSI